MVQRGSGRGRGAVGTLTHEAADVVAGADGGSVVPFGWHQEHTGRRVGSQLHGEGQCPLAQPLDEGLLGREGRERGSWGVNLPGGG